MPHNAQDLNRWFEEEVHPHGSHLRAYLKGKFPSIVDADDVVQESFLRLWKTGHTGTVYSPKAWLYTAAKRIALNILRKRKNSLLVDSEDQPIEEVAVDENNPHAQLANAERVQLLANALLSLPPRCQEVIIQHKLKGRSRQEIAREFGMSERTVEAHVRKGMLRCRANILKAVSQNCDREH